MTMVKNMTKMVKKKKKMRRKKVMKKKKKKKLLPESVRLKVMMMMMSMLVRELIHKHLFMNSFFYPFLMVIRLYLFII